MSSKAQVPGFSSYLLQQVALLATPPLRVSHARGSSFQDERILSCLVPGARDFARGFCERGSLEQCKESGFVLVLVLVSGVQLLLRSPVVAQMHLLISSSPPWMQFHLVPVNAQD